MLANPTTTTIKEDTKTKTHSSIENTKETSEETTSISTFIEEEGDDLTIDVDCDLCRTQCTLEEDNTNKCEYEFNRTYYSTYRTLFSVEVSQMKRSPILSIL